MFEFVEFLIAGAFLGVTYGLLAMPISILFVSTDKIDLAIGGYAVLAAAVAAKVGGAAGIPLGIAAACLAASVVGLISTTLDRKPHQDLLTAVLASFGFYVFLESFILTVFGKDPFRLEAFGSFISVAGLRLSPQSPINLSVGLLLIGLLYFLLYRS